MNGGRRRSQPSLQHHHHDCFCCLAGLDTQLSTPQVIKWRLHVQRKRTCEHPRWLARQVAGRPRSLYLESMRRFTSILVHTADLSHHAEITLQVVPRLKYELSLLVDNEKKELRNISNETWEPEKHLYVPCFLHTCTWRSSNTSNTLR